MTRAGRTHRLLAAAAATLLAAAAFATAALAHVERTSYWPDPNADTSLTPAAGGAPPKVRSLASALPRNRKLARKGKARFKAGRAFRPRKGAGKVRVVCQKRSLRTATREIRRARRKGYRDRPTMATRKLTGTQAKRYRRYNRALFRLCGFREIQPAVTASHNNDRVVVMPGVYTEPTARKVPDLPKECEPYRTTSEKGSGAVSYEYQYRCPNAQALVAVIGRALGPGQDPASSPTGRPDPHGIPNLGPCIRCNLQIEGSGPAPDDTVIDAGRKKSGDGAPRGSKKDVGIKADRADGFVLKDMTIRHAAEHDVYVLETDGYQLVRGRYMYAGEYGTLTFASDHGVTRVCEAAGNGDAGVYPGGAPDTGAQRREDFYPSQRLNQVITKCDSHHNNLGYSGTMGNATHVYDNNFYGNTTGIATDSFYAGGHPGFPQDSAIVREQPDLLEQLQHLRRRLRRGVLDPGPDRRRHPDRGRQSEPGQEQPHLRQLAPRRDAVRRPGRDLVRSVPGRRLAAVHPAGGGDDVQRQSLPGQHDGPHGDRRADAQRRRLLVGRVPVQPGQLLRPERRLRRPGRPHLERPARVAQRRPGARLRCQARLRLAPERRHRRLAEGERAGRLLPAARGRLERPGLVRLVRPAAQAGQHRQRRRRRGQRRGAPGPDLGADRDRRDVPEAPGALHPARALRRDAHVRPVRQATRLAGVVLVTALAVAAAGCGSAGGGARGAAPARTAAPTSVAGDDGRSVALIGGKAIQSARCRQWRAGTRPQQDRVLVTLQRLVGGPTPYGRATALEPDRARALFDRACARRYARGFLLYELFTRASAFSRRGSPSL